MLKINNNIKVLWICSWYPNRHHKNSGNFIYRQALATSKYCDLTLVHAVQSTVYDYEFEYIEDGFSTIIVYYRSTKNPLLKIWRIFNSYYKAYCSLKQETSNFKLFHLHVLYPSGIFGWYLDFIKNIPFLVTEHRGGYIHKSGSYNGFVMKLFTKITFSRAKMVLPISLFFNAALKRHGLSRPFKVVPNVVDTDLFQIEKKNNAVFRFIHVGYLLDYVKNQSGILRVVNLLKKAGFNFEFYFIGEGADKSLFYLMADDINKGKKIVFFEGQKQHEQVADYLKQSDALVLFSNIEGLPCVMLEAMSCGLPVIATETGGINEWVTPETGVLIDIGNEEQLFKAMIHVMENKNEYHAELIRQKVVETCSNEVVGQAIYQAYQAVLQH